MDLLSRYLQAVKFFLPRAQQDDIIRELSDNLLSQVEDREAALGRPLNEDEQAAILRAHGHPMLVAGRYRSRQHLIGPVFFPVYLFALKVGLGIALLVTIITGTITSVLEARTAVDGTVGDVVEHIVAALLAYPGRALMVFGWTTLCFAALDLMQAHVKFTAGWDPRKLPEIVVHEHARSRMQAAVELCFIWAGTIWLMLVPRMPFLILGPAAAFVEPAPIWRVVYIPILLMAVAHGAIVFVDVLRPYWTPARSYARLALNAAGLIVLFVLFRAGEWLVPLSIAPSSAGVPFTDLVGLMNLGVQVGLVVAFVVNVWEIARECLRLKHRRRTLPPDSAHVSPVL